MGLANVRGPMFGKCPNEIGHEPIGGPIAAADDVAGPSRRKPDLRSFGVEERQTPALHGELATSLATAIWVVAAEHVDLAVGARLVAIAVNLIARCYDAGTHRRN